MAERIDEIGFGGLRLIQEDKSFCYGVDAVLLADYSKASPKDRVLDIGCGNGAPPLSAGLSTHREASPVSTYKLMLWSWQREVPC